MGLLIKKEGEEERLITLDEIQRIEDVILLKAEEKVRTRKSEPETEPEKEPSKPKKDNICSECGWENKKNTKFCVKCGKQLG